jgi:hypothetical protein
MIQDETFSYRTIVQNFLEIKHFGRETLVEV